MKRDQNGNSESLSGVLCAERVSYNPRVNYFLLHALLKINFIMFIKY